MIGGTNFASTSLQREWSELSEVFVKLHSQANVTCLLELRGAELALTMSSSLPNTNQHQFSDKLDAATVTTKRGPIRNQTKLLHPRLAFVRQRRDLCYQCRLSLILDFSIWNGLRRKKRLDEDVDRPEFGRLGPTRRYI